MSDIVLVALIAAIPSTLTVILGWCNGRKLNTIHRLTNSFATAQAKVIEEKSTEISGLKVEAQAQKDRK